ncbi:MAG TPA: hypothetical protein VLO11_13900 [Luteolibacter sp.]|nr:hypothetical protein [Luteolibacter sp.]
MHRLPSSKAIVRMRITAILICLKCLAAPLSAAVFIYGFVQNDDAKIIAGLVLVFVTVLLVIAQWLFAARTHCPLCITPVMMSKGCAKHRHARRFLGSHRLHVALSVLFTGGFRCPYCGEPSVLEVRERGGS